MTNSRHVPSMSEDYHCKKCGVDDCEIHRVHCSICNMGFESRHRLGLHQFFYNHKIQKVNSVK